MSRGISTSRPRARVVAHVLILLILAYSWGGVAASPQSMGGANDASALAVAPGGAWAWGLGESGQLGIGQGQQQCDTTIYGDTAPCSDVPIGMLRLERDVIVVEAGDFYSLALKADGTVWAAGENARGQLGFLATERCGRFSLPCAQVANRVPDLTGVTAIAAGGGFSLALKGDGTVWAWGDNDAGQLGLDPGAPDSPRCDTGAQAAPCRVTPGPIAGLRDITAIAAGSRFALALARDGSVWSWGANDIGQLGNGLSGTDGGGSQFIATPAPVSALGGATAIAAGAGFGLAVRGDTTVWTWGANEAGQLGNGAAGSEHFCRCVPTPAPVGGLSGAVEVAGGSSHSLARKADGTVWSWGYNGHGQLGTGTASSTGCQCVPTPQRVLGLNGATSIAASDFSLATKADGTAWGWGLNLDRALGTPATTTCRPATRDRPCNPLPTAIDGLPGARQVSAGSTFGLAIAAPHQTFADVATDYWADAQIGEFAARGITNGCGTDEQGRRVFCPERGVTRAEMAAFITRTLGQGNPATPATPTFADVPPDYWAYAQIEVFARLGITTGCGDDENGQRLYCPERGVTRAEMAAFLDRAKGQAELRPDTPTFADVPPTYWAYGWIERFFTLGVTTGCGTDDVGNRVYCPERGVTRAEMAVFIIRAYP